MIRRQRTLIENLHEENFIAQMVIRTMFITWLNNVEITQHKVKKYIWHIPVNRLSVYSQVPVLNGTYYHKKCPAPCSSVTGRFHSIITRNLQLYTFNLNFEIQDVPAIFSIPAHTQLDIRNSVW